MIAIVAAVAAAETIRRIKQQQIKIALDAAKKNEKKKKTEKHWSNTPVSEERHWDK